ncbi:hypothetical protein Fcan01_22287 [Folsomia candida]|uniref:Uncharacterized protein n=1 Tax=Folsomia candida TaxID=158441 RepID=A0A226DBJ9_FOLCA|nr:hypothetical protein Fcan01_22287 [Folsomia candida]
MKLYFILISGGLLSSLILLGVVSGFREEDFDTVEITDDTSPRASSISITCKTARNEDGVCKRFKECYPLFRLRDLEETETEQISGRDIVPAIQNLELENIYRNVSGPCDKDVLNAISNINIGKGVSTNEYVCCPNEKKKPVNQPTRPPAPPTPRPEVVGDKKCGKTFVTYRDDEGDASGNVTSSETGALRIVNGRQAQKGEFPYAVIN